MGLTRKSHRAGSVYVLGPKGRDSIAQGDSPGIGNATLFFLALKGRDSRERQTSRAPLGLIPRNRNGPFPTPQQKRPQEQLCITLGRATRAKQFRPVTLARRRLMLDRLKLIRRGGRPIFKTCPILDQPSIGGICCWISSSFPSALWSPERMVPKPSHSGRKLGKRGSANASNCQMVCHPRTAFGECSCD